MIAYVDGGSRSSNGPAGIGVVVEHSTGRRVEISQFIGARDNNFAEYAALLVALEYAAAYDSPRLQVFSDSEVVVRQISGSYNCQSPMLRDIYDACRGLIEQFQEFGITHIRRENNADADRLARQAMDRAVREKASRSEASVLEATLARVAERLQKARPLLPLEQAG